MLKIGYVRRPGAGADDDTDVLTAAGCQVIRVEDVDSGGSTLAAVLEFIGPGEQLVVTRLDRLASRSRDLLATLDGLEARGASLRVLEPELVSQGSSGRALRAVLEAVSLIEPREARRRRRSPAANQEIFALQRAGLGPVEIARRLGVSRMTVWRKLRALEIAEA